MWKRLLVPHDFSTCAGRAILLAAELAELHHARVTVLHACPLPPNVAPDALIVAPETGATVRLDEYTTRGAQRTLERIAAPLRERGIEVSTVAVAAASGDIAGAILAAAGDADVMIVGTHGRKGLSHLLLGSIAEKLVRQAEIPVITVRDATPAPKPTREERLAEDEAAG